MKADFAIVSGWRSEHATNGFEEVCDRAVVLRELALQFVEFDGQFLVRGEQARAGA